MKLVLASRSPRRRELLSLITDQFEVVASHFDESSITESDPEALVKSLSYHKAAAVQASESTVVIGADTVVVSPEGEIFGIPAGEEEAGRMLRVLSGKTHCVMTGVTLLGGGQRITFCETTRVTFRPLGEEELRRYICSGEPFDKAGGYGIQGKAALFVTGIEGDFYNVVGLPVARLFLALQGLEGLLGESCHKNGAVRKNS